MFNKTHTLSINTTYTVQNIQLLHVSAKSRWIFFTIRVVLMDYLIVLLTEKTKGMNRIKVNIQISNTL